MVVLANDKKKTRWNIKTESKASQNNIATHHRNMLKKIPQSDDDLMEALFESFIMARRGKTNTIDEARFEAFWYENLEQLCDDIIHRRYKPSRSKAFITHNPVMREIFAAPFRDRIVHHLLYAIVAPWWDRRFIETSFSCRNGKGTDYGVAQLQRAMRKVSQNQTKKAYVIKGDLSGYFMSLNRDLLYEKVIWGLNRQFPDKGWLYELCKFLWYEVIYDDPTMGARRVGRLSDWDKLPKNKSLFSQPVGVGIVIGNLTSQLLSNIVLNEFDWWMKRDLGFKYYGRYVDDFYIVIPENEYGYAMELMSTAIPQYLADMGLTLHPGKRYVQEVAKGCPFLGKMIKVDCLLPGKRFKKNARAALKEFAMIGDNYDGVVSYIGMTKHINAKKYMAKVFDEIGSTYRF